MILLPLAVHRNRPSKASVRLSGASVGPFSLPACRGSTGLYETRRVQFKYQYNEDSGFLYGESC